MTMGDDRVTMLVTIYFMCYRINVMSTQPNLSKSDDGDDVCPYSSVMAKDNIL